MIALAIMAFWAWVWFMGFCIAVSLVWLILKGLFYVLISPIWLAGWAMEAQDKAEAAKADRRLRADRAKNASNFCWSHW